MIVRLSLEVHLPGYDGGRAFAHRIAKLPVSEKKATGLTAVDPLENVHAFNMHYILPWKRGKLTTPS